MATIQFAITPGLSHLIIQWTYKNILTIRLLAFLPRGIISILYQKWCTYRSENGFWRSNAKITHVMTIV